MESKVDVELCVGCGLCANICPEVFAMEEDKVKVTVNPVPDSSQDCVQQAKEDCPVEAITIEE